jgi:hypothetical protein
VKGSRVVSAGPECTSGFCAPHLTIIWVWDREQKVGDLADLDRSGRRVGRGDASAKLSNLEDQRGGQSYKG